MFVFVLEITSGCGEPPTLLCTERMRRSVWCICVCVSVCVCVSEGSSCLRRGHRTLIALADMRNSMYPSHCVLSQLHTWFNTSDCFFSSLL